MLGETGFWVGIAAGLFIGGTLGALAMAMGSVAKRIDEEFDLIDLNLDHDFRFYPANYTGQDLEIARAICCGEHCRTDTEHCHAVDHVREARRVRCFLSRREVSSYPLEEEDDHDAVRQPGGSY